MGTPMISWDGKENLQVHKYLVNLEEHMAGGLAFNSCQSAISACLETLGSRLQPISVIMPVNAPFDALMGVIRSNARPVITDLDPWTFQADAKQVAQALQDLPEAVVYLNRPGGMAVSPALLEAVQDVPTICDTRLMPLESDMLFTFNIYDLSLVCGEGAVMYAKDPDIKKDLIQVRADSKSELPEVCASFVYTRQPLMGDYPTGKYYRELLENSEKSGIIGFQGDLPQSTYLVKVKDAHAVMSRFNSIGLQLEYGCIPVYRYEIARKRFPVDLNYPVAEKLHKELVLLPNHEGIKRERFLEEIWNV